MRNMIIYGKTNGVFKKFLACMHIARSGSLNQTEQMIRKVGFVYKKYIHNLLSLKYFEY